MIQPNDSFAALFADSPLSVNRLAFRRSMPNLELIVFAQWSSRRVKNGRKMSERFYDNSELSCKFLVILELIHVYHSLEALETLKTGSGIMNQFVRISSL